MTLADRIIETEAMNLRDFVRKLTDGEFLIPSFQREFVWDPQDIIKLWDSLYRFYPIGSILYWNTDIRLNIHRNIGGDLRTNGRDKANERTEWVYILDGQQRATALLISLFGLSTRGIARSSYVPALYFDAVSGTFFFEDMLGRRRREVPDAFLIRLGEALEWGPKGGPVIEDQPGYDPAIQGHLNQLRRVFTDYNLSLIRIQGFDIPAVREIFERINQEGKDLQSMDLMIARTFQNYAYLVEDDV